MRIILVAPIKIYQKWISPMFAPRCKYYPSCSSYTVTAIENYGIKGVAMAIWRLMRCNPWSHGGVDYVLVSEKKKENHSSKNEKKEKVTING